MKLKLDLHPIFSDSRKIEQSLVDVIAEAVEKRASEIEIIPGKGSGALKKTVLRFLERPEIKCQYHRVEKDDENFGRIFVHFRFQTGQGGQGTSAPKPLFSGECFCCQGEVTVRPDSSPFPGERIQVTRDCPSCGSPNSVSVFVGRSGKVTVTIEPGYEAEP